MKVERKESKFEPIVIILESQFEVDVLRELCGSVGGRSKARDFTSSVYESLGEFSDQDENFYFEGSIQTVS